MSFQPYLSEPTPCWYCVHFDGMASHGSSALCRNRPGPRVCSMPLWGCSSWMREVGCDDEPFVQVITRPELRPMDESATVPWAP